MPVNVSLSCVFRLPDGWAMAPSTVCDWVRRFADLGVQRITLCDTTGMAYPDRWRG